MSDDGFGTAELRDGETRDDSAHCSRNVAQRYEAGAGDPCPECEDGVLEDPECPVCPECGYSKGDGGQADA